MLLQKLHLNCYEMQMLAKEEVQDFWNNYLNIRRESNCIWYRTCVAKIWCPMSNVRGYYFFLFYEVCSLFRLSLLVLKRFKIYSTAMISALVFHSYCKLFCYRFIHQAKALVIFKCTISLITYSDISSPKLNALNVEEENKILPLACLFWSLLDPRLFTDTHLFFDHSNYLIESSVIVSATVLIMGSSSVLLVFSYYSALILTPDS